MNFLYWIICTHHTWRVFAVQSMCHPICLKTSWKGFTFTRINREKALDYDRTRKFKRYAIWYLSKHIYFCIRIRVFTIDISYFVLSIFSKLNYSWWRLSFGKNATHFTYQFSRFSSQDLHKAFNRNNRIDITEIYIRDFILAAIKFHSRHSCIFAAINTIRLTEKRARKNLEKRIRHSSGMQIAYKPAICLTNSLSVLPPLVIYLGVKKT